MSRWVAYTVGVGLAALVASPALRGTKDSYPLSTYPMFAAKRDNPRLYVAEAVSADGSRARLAPEFLGTNEVMQAAVVVRRAVRGGEQRTKQLCEDITERVAQSPRLASVRFVELTSAEYDPVAYFVSRAEAQHPTLHFRCPVQK